MKDNDLIKFFKGKGIIVEALSVLIFSAAMLAYSLVSHYAAGVEWKLSPYLFPFLISILTGILSISLLIEGVKKNQSADQKLLKAVNLKGAFIMFALALGHYFLMRFISFIPGTIIFLVAAFLYLGERRIWLIALLSSITTIIIYLIFGVLLHVMLP